MSPNGHETPPHVSQAPLNPDLIVMPSDSELDSPDKGGTEPSDTVVRLPETAELPKTLSEAHKEIMRLRSELSKYGHTLVQLIQAREGERATSRNVELALEKIATSDPLTGLPNRRVFEDRLASSVYSFGGRRSDKQRPGCVMIIDIDRFKEVNDSAGHSVGDELLVEVAGKLGKALRNPDELARYGGDEFGVLIENASKEECEEIAARLHKAADELVPKGPNNIKATFSIGAVLLRSGDPDELLRKADQALYRAKEAGRNQVVFADS